MIVVILIRSSFSNCLVEQVKQISNVYAHHLAKFVLSSEDTIWIEDYHHCIASYVVADMVA